MSEIVGFDFATVNGSRVVPRTYPVLYHGSGHESRATFDENDGLPARGKDIELIRHVQPPPGSQPDSAFRGTTSYPVSPALDAGVLWWIGKTYDTA